MPEPTTSFLVATAGFTTLATLNNIGGNDIRPLTGYQYVQKGGEEMDRTLDILNSPEGKADEKWALERGDFLRRHHKLQEERNQLEDKTSSYLGSVMNRGAARDFQRNSNTLLTNTKRSSDRRRCLNGIEEAELYAAIEFQTIQRQARRPGDYYPDEHYPNEYDPEEQQRLERQRRREQRRRDEEYRQGHSNTALPVLNVRPAYSQNPTYPQVAMYPPGAAPPQVPYGGSSSSSGWYPGPGQNWPPYTS